MCRDNDGHGPFQGPSETDLSDFLGDFVPAKAWTDTDLSTLFGLNTLETSNLDIALSLAARGLAVCPQRNWGDGDGWKPIAKFPERATTDPAQIRKWWRDWPESRVALITGERNGISVLDVDVKNGKDGLASLSALGFDDHRAMSPVRTITPSGGLHLFFAYKPDLKARVGKIAPGLDVRNNGGFVIAPGSIKNGDRYLVEGEELARGMPLPDWPETLTSPETPERQPVSIQVASEFHRQWARDYLNTLATEVAATPEGGRQAALNNASLWAGGAGAHGALSREESATVLIDAGKSCGLSDREARSTFNHGWGDGLRKPVDLPVDHGALEDFDDLGNEVAGQCGCPDKSTCLCELLGIPMAPQKRGGNLEWFVDAVMPKSAPYIVKDVLDQGASSVMYGPSNAGKTFVALDLAYHLASAQEGDDWCGRRVTRTAVMYCALEGGNGFKKRLLALRSKHGGADVPFAYRCAGANLLAKDDKGDVKTIVRMAREMHGDRRAAGLPTMIVIDTLSRALAGGNENGPEDMTAFIANVDRIRADTGAHVMIIHHTGKDTAKGMRGHSSLIAAIDSELEVARPDSGRTVTLHVGKQRDAMSDYDLQAGTLETVTIGEGEDGEAIESAVLQWGAPFPGKQSTREKRPSGQTAIALQILEGMAQPVSKQDWKQACVASDAFCASDKPDTRRTAFTRAVQDLLRGKWVSDDQRGFSACDGFDLPGQTQTNADMSETSNPANRQHSRTDTDTTL